MDLGYVQYQESLKGLESISEGIRRNLLYEAFPRYIPIDFANQPGFKGLKSFSYEKEILFISRFFYRGMKDEWGRPLLEAYIVAIHRDEFQKYFRDIGLIVNLLDLMAEQEALDKEKFLAMLESKSFFIDSERFSDFIDLLRKIEPVFSSQVLGSIIDKRELIIPADSNSKSLIKVIFGFLPKAVLYSISISSICTNPLADDRENVIITPIEIGKTKKPVVDFKSKTVWNGTKNELIHFIIEELIENAWFGFSPIELFNFLIDYLDLAGTGKILDPTEISEKLDAMKKTLLKADRLYNLLKRNLKRIT